MDISNVVVMSYNVSNPHFTLIRWKCLCIPVYNVLVMLL